MSARLRGGMAALRDARAYLRELTRFSPISVSCEAWLSQGKDGDHRAGFRNFCAVWLPDWNH
jgi:hypothetical protein